ncbi:hypothetical protein V6N12_061170 [Hibiscus sabdariffa]|uniref:BED-type domain-containing protein n=1 Tax=Hibiscus sabdariffa TaxID=183260 RepID=A0ABR2DWA1_9ROSI
MDNFDQKLGPDFFKNLSAEAVTPLNVVHEEIYESSSKRPKTTSKVWDIFEKLPAQQGDSKAICKLCRRIYTAKTTSGTSHLRRHIEACVKRGNHDVDPRSLEACFKPVKRDANRVTLSHDTLIAATTSLKNYKIDVDEIHQAIAMMIIVDEQPFTVVEEAGFRRLLGAACPEFPVLSRSSIKRDIISIYLKERENIRELLATCPGRICLTSGTWKSNCDDHFNCVSAHFIDHEWRLQKRILRFKLIPPPYDSLSVADEIALCMVQWNIEHKVFSVTLENLSSDDCVADMLRSRLAVKKAAWKVHSRLFDMVRGPENFMTRMVREMHSKLNQYWSAYNLILSCAAILDPRYKIKFVEYCYTKLYGSGAQKYVSVSVNTLYGLFEEYMQNYARPSHATEISAATSKISNDKDDDGFEDYETFQSARFRTQVEKSQLDLYLEEPSHDLNSEMDIGCWLLIGQEVRALWKADPKMIAPVLVAAMMIIRSVISGIVFEGNRAMGSYKWTPDCPRLCKE